MEKKQIDELFTNYMVAKRRRESEQYRAKLEAANLEFQQNHWEELTIDTIADMPDSEFKKFEQNLFDLESGKRWEDNYIKDQAALSATISNIITETTFKEKPHCITETTFKEKPRCITKTEIYVSVVLMLIFCFVLFIIFMKKL